MSSLKSLFVRDGRVILFWKIPFYIICVTAMFAIPEFFGSAQGKLDARHFGGLLIASVLRAGGAVFVTWLFMRRVEGLTFQKLGLDSLRGRWRDALLGFGASALLIGAVFAIQLAGGWYEIVGLETATSGPLAVGVSLLVELVRCGCIGVREEVAYRGFIYMSLAERSPPWRANLISGALFALMHANPVHFNVTFAISLMMWSAILVLSRVVTGSLWFAIGWHAAWDWTQGTLGMWDVGSADYGHALVHLVQPGPTWLVNSAPAIEGGVLFMVPAALIFALALAWMQKKQAAQAVGG
jgi:membrane protease YdiL (CAAX protease family)